MNAETQLTLAYIAIGANDAWHEHRKNKTGDEFGGHTGYIAKAIEVAQFVENVGNEFREHPCVFAYEVAEAMGQEHGARMINGNANEFDALLTVMLSAGYDAIACHAAQFKVRNAFVKYYVVTARGVRWYFDYADHASASAQLCNADQVTYAHELPPGEIVTDDEEFAAWFNGEDV